MLQRSEMDGAHVININDLVISMEREHYYGLSTDKNGEEEESARPLICRTNRHIRYKCEDAFSPYFLSVGPYSHKVPATNAMQNTKYEYLNYILNSKLGKGLQECLGAMKQLEKQAWSYYAGDIGMDSNDFLKMLLLDGCFLLISFKGIEVSIPELQGSNESKRMIEARLDENDIVNEETQDVRRREVDQEYSSPADLLYIQHFWHDILLFENQFPFFVIKTIHELIVGGSDSTSMLIENVMQSLEGVLGCYPKALCKSNMPKHFHHLLHLCHLYFRPTSIDVGGNIHHTQFPLFHNLLDLSGFSTTSGEGLQIPHQTNPWRRATEYQKSGIDFKKRYICSENLHSLLDIEFCNGVMEIPCLTIHPNTQSLFCNLIAFEQTCPQFGTYITSYIIFLSRLVSMPDDVTLLTRRGIIVHQLHCDAEVSDLFRMINECVLSDFNSDSYLEPLCNRLEAHYQSQRPILREFLGSITSKVREWTQKSESSGLTTTMSPAATSV